MSDASIYVTPRDVANLDVCSFYHTMEIPGYGLVEGAWDLREGLRDYLGGVDFRGKRVLEMGTASGYLCFAMEEFGAEVVAFDIADDQARDIVPFVGQDHERIVASEKEEMRRVKNAFWLSHKALGSKARAVYGSIYGVPQGHRPCRHHDVHVDPAAPARSIPRLAERARVDHRDRNHHGAAAAPSVADDRARQNITPPDSIPAEPQQDEGVGKLVEVHSAGVDGDDRDPGLRGRRAQPSQADELWA